MTGIMVMLATVHPARAGKTPEELMHNGSGDWVMAAWRHPVYLALVIAGLVRAVYQAGPTYAVGKRRRAFEGLRPVPPDDPVAQALLGKPHPRPGRNPVRYWTIKE